MQGQQLSRPWPDLWQLLSVKPVDDERMRLASGDWSSDFVRPSAFTLQGKKFPRAFLREKIPRKIREASEIFACLFAFDPLGSALQDILTEFSPNSAERFPTIN